jgi:uncharacterized protein YbbC (DUF1343 family)
MNAVQLQTAFAERNCAGFSLFATSYTPESGLYAGEICHGLQFFVTDETVFKPVQTGIALIQIICGLYPLQIKERLYCTAANPTGEGHLDKLLGIPYAFEKMLQQQPVDTCIAAEWKTIMKEHLLY